MTNLQGVRSGSKRLLWLLVGLAAFAFLTAAPFFLRGYWVRVITNMFMFAILAESVNIIAGYCGYLALGNMLFFGMGAYVVAVLMVKLGVSFFPALLAAGLGSCLFSVLMGLPILRLKSQYFLTGTVGLMKLAEEVTRNIPYTGGGQGLTLPIYPGGPQAANLFFYFCMFVLMLAVVGTTLLISRSHLGYAFLSIKSDEQAASVMGINPTPYKTIAWALSALFTGMAGGVYAYWMSYIDPVEAFQIAPSIKMYLMMTLGGSATVIGPVLGAFFVEFISEVVWGRFLEIHFLILGLILVLVVIFTPKGLVGLAGKRFSFSDLLKGIRQNRV